MRKYILFFGALFVGSIILVLSRREYVIDDVLKKALEKTPQVHSFTATSQDFDQNGKKLSEVLEKFNDDDWEMKLINGKDVVSDWIRISDVMYVLDTNDGLYWQMTYDPSIAPISKVDIRKTFSGLKDSINSGKVKIAVFGSEPCLESICNRYNLIDPHDFELSRYLWIDKKTGDIFQEQYLLGNGQTSMTVYSALDRTNILVPSSIKRTPEGADPMTLPGFVKL